jgi:hypothetical protein
MPGLRDTLRTLADDFVNGVLAAVRAASLDELSGLGAAGSTRPGRKARRTSDDVEKLADRVVELIASSGGNVAVSEIARALDVAKADLGRPLSVAVKAGRIRKTGEKRRTRYHPAGKGKKK